VALVFFLPLLIDSGGNAGAQAATLAVRALATGDVVVRDWVWLLGKELAVASALGITMAVAVWSATPYRGPAGSRTARTTVGVSPPSSTDGRASSCRPLCQSPGSRANGSARWSASMTSRSSRGSTS
jgi:hypothetical protein